jgi:hypothetical protein
LETVAALSSSPVAKMFFKCLLTAAFWTPKSSAIFNCVSQMLSLE